MLRLRKSCAANGNRSAESCHLMKCAFSFALRSRFTACPGLLGVQPRQRKKVPSGTLANGKGYEITSKSQSIQHFIRRRAYPLCLRRCTAEGCINSIARSEERRVGKEC